MNDEEKYDAEYIKRLQEIAGENFKLMHTSACFILPFVPATIEEMRKNAVPILQMGMAIYLDKPIVLIVEEPGAHLVPENLRRAALHVAVCRANDRDDYKRAVRDCIEKVLEYERQRATGERV